MIGSKDNMETFDNFLNNYSHITEWLVDLMTAIAIEISCESCAGILKVNE